MRLHAGPWGWGWRPPRAVLPASSLFPQASAHNVPCCPTPSLLSSWPASLCPQAWGQPCPPGAAAPLSNPRSGMGSGDPAAWAQRPSAGSSLAQHIPLVASSLRSPGAGAAVQLPAPRYWGPLAGPFSCSPQNGSCWGALPGPGSGRGWGSATQVDPPVLHLHVSTASHGGSRDQGAWKAAVPQGPKKVSSSLNLGAGTFSPGQRWRSGRQTWGPTWQTRCGQQVALCCPVTGDSRGPF